MNSDRIKKRVFARNRGQLSLSVLLPIAGNRVESQLLSRDAIKLQEQVGGEGSLTDEVFSNEAKRSKKKQVNREAGRQTSVSRGAISPEIWRCDRKRSSIGRYCVVNNVSGKGVSVADRSELLLT